MVTHLLVRRRDRREILVTLDRLLAAEFSAAEDKDRGNDRDHTADDNSKSAVAVFVHGVNPTFTAQRGSRPPGMTGTDAYGSGREFGRNRCKILTISGNEAAR